MQIPHRNQLTSPGPRRNFRDDQKNKPAEVILKEMTVTFNSITTSRNPQDITRESMKELVKSQYSVIFEGLGKFSRELYKLRLKSNSTPAKHSP